MNRTKKFSIAILFIQYFFLLQSISYSQTQVIVHIQHPPPNQLFIEDLWKITLTNTATAPLNIFLTGSIVESNGGELLNARTQGFVLNSGTSILNPSQLGDISIQYSGTEIEKIIKKTGAFPSGDYTICVHAIEVGSKTELGYDCIVQKVNNLTPPKLVYPNNKLQISSDFPVFSWIPPSPYRTNQIISYELIIVEILSRQSLNDAMNSNPAWYEQKNISTTIQQYSLASRGFIDGKRYAWKIKCYLNNDFVNESEIREFIFDKNTYVTNYNNKDFINIKYGGKQTYGEYNDLYFVDNTSDNTKSNLFENDLKLKLHDYTGASLSGKIKKHDLIFSGRSNIYGSFANRKGTNQQLPRNIARWQFSPTFIAFKLPVSLNLLLSTEQNSVRQSINSFSIIFNPSILIDQLKNAAASKILGGGNIREYESLKGLIQNPESIKEISILKEMEKHIDSTNIESYNILKKKVDMIREAEKKIKELEILNKDLADIRTSKDPEQILNKFQKFVPTSGLNRFMLSFRNIGIGTNYPDYTDFTLKGASVTGLNVELNPGLFYFAFAGIRNQKAVERTDERQPTFSRNILSGRLGIGQLNSTHFFVTYMYAKDNQNSIVRDSLTTVTPMKNDVLGIETKFSFLKNCLSVEGEISGSLFTRDVTSPQISNPSVPEILKNVFGVNMSSSFDYAYSIKTSYEKDLTKASVKLSMIGPGYVSLGSPNLRNDNFGIEVNVEHSLSNNYAFVSAYYKREKDNLIPWKRNTTTNTFFGATLNLTIPDYPILNLSYTPFYQSNNADSNSFKIDNNSQFFNATLFHNTIIKTFSFNSILNYIFQKSNVFNSGGDFSSHVFSINEMISFAFPLGVELGYTLNNNKVNDESTSLSTFDIAVSYPLIVNLDAKAGINYSIEKNSNKAGFKLDLSYKIAKYGTLTFSAHNNVYNDRIIASNKYNEFVISSSFITQW